MKSLNFSFADLVAGVGSFIGTRNVIYINNNLTKPECSEAGSLVIMDPVAAQADFLYTHSINAMCSAW